MNTIFRVWFRSKSVIRKCSTLVGGVYRSFFLSKNVTSFRSLDHYQRRRVEKKKFQNLVDIIL